MSMQSKLEKSVVLFYMSILFVKTKMAMKLQEVVRFCLLMEKLEKKSLQERKIYYL